MPLAVQNETDAEVSGDFFRLHDAVYADLGPAGHPAGLPWLFDGTGSLLI